MIEEYDRTVNPNLDNGREHRVGADLYDWEINNTYDIANVVPDVKTFIDELYTMSLYSQEVQCDISRIYGTMSKFRRDVSINAELGVGYYNYTLEIPIKNIRCFKTLALKRANPRIYTIEDSCNQTDIFDRRLMMFINGEYFPGVRFYAEENRFVLIIEVYSGMVSLKQMNYWIDNDVKWSILVLPFSSCKSKFGLRSEIVTNRKIPFTALKSISSVQYVNRNLWLTSIATDTTNNRAVTVSCIATMKEDEKHDVYLELPPAFAASTVATNISVDAIAIPNAKGGLLLGRARAMTIALDTNPIPPCNIICWETNGDGSVVRYLHDVEVTLYYPNVYTFSNIPDESNLFVTWMYSEDDTTTFFNPIKEYQEFNPNYANDIINDVIPYAIKSYIPMHTTYKETYYLDYVPQATRRNEFTFKFETLKELVNDDTRRLEKIYLKSVAQTAYNWHSNPRYTIEMNTWNNAMFSERTRRDNSKEIIYGKKRVVEFGMDCLYFIIEHEDGREYPVGVWIDGKRCPTTWQFTQGYRTYVYVPKDIITRNSLMEFELMKTRAKTPTIVDMKLSDIHNSIEIPKDFVDISPQNLMIATREETSDFEEDGSVQYIYKVAPNYEMYWLLFGNTPYVNGVPPYVEKEPIPKGKKKTELLANDKHMLTTETDSALKLSAGSIWDPSNDGYTYFLEKGHEVSYLELTSAEYPDDYKDLLQVREMGYYPDVRRRFYEYLPNGEDDMPIYITPITSYFDAKNVRITNIDIHKEWNFVITPDNRTVKLKDFRLEPSANKFRVFLDGRLLDPFKDYHFDASIANGFYLGSIVTFVVLDHIKTKANLMIEYVPYRYELKYRIDNVTNNNIQLRTAKLQRPFSLTYYDVYLNGVRLYPKDITIVSPAKIIINQSLNGQTLSFYERCHDTDIYGNDKVMLKTLIDKISENNEKFRDYLLPGFKRNTSTGCGECASNCTGTCVSLCEHACSRACYGSCTGTCQNEASYNACTDCATRCGQTCGVTCDHTCYTTCSQNCADDCSGTCTNSCAGIVSSQPGEDGPTHVITGCDACSSFCTITCSGDCSSTSTAMGCIGCGTSCISECMGCQGSCVGTLAGLAGETSCSGNCTGNCKNGCSSCTNGCEGCSGTCAHDCVNMCAGTCLQGCKDACENGCTGTAVGRGSASIICAGCYTTCMNLCSNSCGDNCAGGCSSDCGNTCGRSCKDGCYVTCSDICKTGCTTTCVSTANKNVSK